MKVSNSSLIVSYALCRLARFSGLPDLEDPGVTQLVDVNRSHSRSLQAPKVVITSRAGTKIVSRIPSTVRVSMTRPEAVSGGIPSGRGPAPDETAVVIGGQLA